MAQIQNLESLPYLSIDLVSVAKYIYGFSNVCLLFFFSFLVVVDYTDWITREWQRFTVFSSSSFGQGK